MTIAEIYEAERDGKIRVVSPSYSEPSNPLEGIIVQTSEGSLFARASGNWVYIGRDVKFYEGRQKTKPTDWQVKRKAKSG